MYLQPPFWAWETDGVSPFLYKWPVRLAKGIHQDEPAMRSASTGLGLLELVTNRQYDGAYPPNIHTRHLCIPQ